MNSFIGENFLLQNEVGKELFHNYGAKMPIIDYHCHISPREIFEDKRFENITEAWLGGDHYKWRLMRAFGISEKYITGDADPFEKFRAFAGMLPHAIGNPVYSWAHLELKRYFNCDLIINEENANAIWNICNEKLQNDSSFSARGIIESSNVTALVTTDEPIDTLEWHAKIKEDSSFKTKVLPAWRPDKALRILKPDYNDYLENLSKTSGVTITDFDGICSALSIRMNHFAEHGCKASDHGLEGIYHHPATKGELNKIVANRLAGNAVSKEDSLKYEYNLLVFLGKEYYNRNWVFEIHYGAGRDANSTMFEQLGADTGFDYIRPQSGAEGIQQLLDELNSADSLPKTILFSLNPNDDPVLSVISGSFQKEGIRGNVQHGAAWWFNDTKAGMEQQLTTFASESVLGNFVGMLTDSRSFLSYPRHEYFRRILCNLLGSWVENGEYPNDMKMLGEIVENISYKNAVDFFGYYNYPHNKTSHQTK